MSNVVCFKDLGASLKTPDALSFSVLKPNMNDYVSEISVFEPQACQTKEVQVLVPPWSNWVDYSKHFKKLPDTRDGNGRLEII